MIVTILQSRKLGDIEAVYVSNTLEDSIKLAAHLKLLPDASCYQVVARAPEPTLEGIIAVANELAGGEET